MSAIFGVDFRTIVDLIIIAVVAVTLERLLSRYLFHFAKRVKLEPSTSNNLVLMLRILILIFTILAISSVGGVQAEWLLSVSAVGGAAIGFASQKTIGNFIAGLFLIASRPFKVGDYVKIGTAEGLVQEITLNYTKVLTSDNNVISVTNLQILDRDITNYLYLSTRNGNMYCYSFDIGFDHSVSTERLTDLFNRVFNTYASVLPRKPEYLLTALSGFTRVYTVYLYVEKPRDIFTLKPKIIDEVLKRWDAERAKPKE